MVACIDRKMRETNKLKKRDKVVGREMSFEDQRLVSILLDAERESGTGGKKATHREVMKTMRSRIADANEQRLIDGIKKLVG